jgi:hypothetical protein
MIKHSPNPLKTESTSPDNPHQATESTPDCHLPPSPHIFTVIVGIDTERLLANLSETLASANAMASDLAFELEGSRRHVALGIQQLIELGELLANRALDNVAAR